MNLNATLIGQLIAFAIFVWFCMRFVWPPIIKAIETRQATIAQALADAEAARKEQADTQTQVEEELQQAKLKAQEIVDAANRRRNEIIDEAKADAEVTKANIIRQGHAEVESERKRVQEELRLQVANLAIAGAEKIVGQQINKAANNEIIDKLVADLS